MATFNLRLPPLRFSLAAMLIAMTVAAVGFGVWWRLPWQIDYLPQELSEHRQGLSPFGLLGCGTTGEDLTAVWTEEVPYELRQKLAPGYKLGKKPVHAKSGKCWVRRDWQKPWVLDGEVDVFNADGQRIMRARYRNGQLHGEFCSWFTDGKIRETGKYWNGQKDGVWDERKFMSGELISHAEYQRGQKCGVWKLWKIREFYEGGKIVRQEWSSDENDGPHQVMEFDEQEKLKETTYWRNHRTEKVGFERFRAGEYRNRIRHGDWERTTTFGNDALDAPKFAHRGNWTDDLASGEWVFERPAAEPRRLQFQKGELLTINGRPARDLLMQKYASLGEQNSSLSILLRFPDEIKFQNQSRAEALKEVLNHSAIVHLDRRLNWSEEKQQQFFAEKLPSDFYFAQLPGSACLCLILQDSGLAFDFRHHALWLTTPELAAEWKDETNTAPWFEVIVNARPTRYDPPRVVRSLFINEPDKTFTLEDDGMDPDMMRSELFESGWKEAWEKRQMIEFRKPLQCSQGIARRIDPNFDRSRKAVELLDPTAEDYRGRELDHVIAYECEVYDCRLKLRGDTLVFEPRQVSGE